MEPETQIEEPKKFEDLHKATSLSTYLAMVLFILMPFVGGWIGYQYAPEKVVEVERVAVVEPVRNEVIELDGENDNQFSFGEVFIASISEVQRVENGYEVILGGKYNQESIPFLGSKKTLLKLDEDSVWKDKRVGLAQDAKIVLINYTDEPIVQTRDFVDADTFYGVYSGEIERYFYYALPNDNYPFEVLIINDQIVMINQIYTE